MSRHHIENVLDECEFELEGALVIYRLTQAEVARGEKSPAVLGDARHQVRGAIAGVREARRALEAKAARRAANQAEIAAQLRRRATGEWGPEHMAALDRMLGDDAEALKARRRFDCI